MDDQKSVRRQQLMARAQLGDREAFHELLKDIGPFITRSLQLRLPNVNELEDICQEVMVAVYKSRHTYQPDRPFEPWLFAIFRNITNKHIHRVQARSAVEVQVDELPEISVNDDRTSEMELRRATLLHPNRSTRLA